MNSINRVAKLFAYTISFVMVLIAASSPIYAGNGKNKNTKQVKLWQQINESNLQSERGERAVTPKKYLVFRLNQKSLQNTLAELRLENTEADLDNPIIMEIPMPDGTIQRFRIENAPVLSAELAAEFPNWKTFQGYNVDNPTITGRFDWNALGFHGYVSSSKGTVMIDPYQKGETEKYMVFYKHDFGKPSDEFFCRIENQMSKIIKTNPYYDFAPSDLAFTFGTTVRTFRLAIATTGEWARNAAGYNGTQTPTQIRTAALAVITTTINRLNGIYERELASKFELVNPQISDDSRNIIFDDPATDPYDNTDAEAQLTINQNTLTNRVGNANYDIGHLYGTGGGGVASSPSLCSSQKAEGYSARGTNTGDPFTVDYVAHEIGHQFGANHTYNNADPSGACTTRSAADAFEVASGATIMSYVGICSARNLQQYVDTGFPSFHIRSLTEINTNLTTGEPQTTGCGTAAGTNNVPTVSAGNSFTIPRLTPFTLTATASDADASDVSNLLYSWEEYDLAASASGASGIPADTYDVDTDTVLRPLFRAYSPVSGNSRTFPSLVFILNPANNNPAGSNSPPLTYTGTHPTGFPGAICETDVTCVMGENLPTVSRTMNFRVSVRDRRGGVADAGTTVTIAGGAGPFQITAPNAAGIWQINSTQTVTWDVSNTNTAPINATNVNILLSTDGGQTFPITLAANTPNDGTETITVPNNPTTTARIKVEAVGNIFFDISNANFTVGQNNTTVSVNDATGGEGNFSDPTALTFTTGNNASSNENNSDEMSLTFTVSLSAPSPQSVTVNFATANGTATAGEDYTAANGTLTFAPNETSKTITVEILEDTLVEPDETLTVSLSTPTNATIADGTGVGTILNDDGCMFSLSSASANFAAAGGTGSFNVTANSGCNWVAQSNSSWITTTSSGSGSATVNFTVSANASASSRAGAMLVGGLAFTVNQAGVVTPPANNQKYFDYDGDGRTDVSIYRPSLGQWWYLRSSDGANRAYAFGAASDKIVPADYTGDGKTDIAFWRPSTGEWFIIRSENNSYYAFPFGVAGDIPLAADFDGDGKSDPTIFRPSTQVWYTVKSSGGNEIRQFGSMGDLPVAADYDGDRRADLAIFRPSVSQWWILKSSGGNLVYQFGEPGTKAVAADYTGDGKTDIAYYKPTTGEWFVVRSENQSYYAAPFGIVGDVPIPGDYDADGRADFAVFRPSNSGWFVSKSTGGTLILSFGQNGDIPTPNAFVP